MNERSFWRARSITSCGKRRPATTSLLSIFYLASIIVPKRWHWIIFKSVAKSIIRIRRVALGTLAECYLFLGRYKLIPPLISEMLALPEGLKNVAYPMLLSGLTALARRDSQEAAAQLQTALDHAFEESYRGFQPTALAWLGAAELANGELEAAHHHTKAAVSLPESGAIFTPQEIWWWHYQTSCSKAKRLDDEEAAPLPDDLFEILDHACRLMLDFIANLADEGLRRNYLNKVPINRDITLNWVRKAAARGEALDPFTKRDTESTSFVEQFQRLVETGNRLTAQRDPSTLPETIRNEFVELCGAERAVVALRAVDDTLNWAATLGLGPEEKIEDRHFIEKHLTEARALREALLRDNEGTVPEDAVPELHLRSVVALPLVSQGKLWGVLYGDMRHIFGRFSEQDLALLNLLANQAAAALENANWVQGLERKVEQRTAELQTANSSLEERNAELAIINSIQAGLVAQKICRASTT